MPQERFINRNMETWGRSQARQRRMGKPQRDHSEMQTAKQTEARFLGGPLCNHFPSLGWKTWMGVAEGSITGGQASFGACRGSVSIQPAC